MKQTSTFKNYEKGFPTVPVLDKSLIFSTNYSPVTSTMKKTSLFLQHIKSANKKPEADAPIINEMPSQDRTQVKIKEKLTLINCCKTLKDFDKEDIDKENQRILNQMDEKEIIEEKEQLLAKLGNLIACSVINSCREDSMLVMNSSTDLKEAMAN